MTTLPDFTDPPIDEVVLGIQFDAIPTYQVIDTYKVWEQFREKFPKVEEKPPLLPQLEIFGRQPLFDISFDNRPPRPRSWFVSADDTHLLQFQDGRLLLSWRKRSDTSDSGHPYPRYESIANRFTT